MKQKTLGSLGSHNLNSMSGSKSFSCTETLKNLNNQQFMKFAIQIESSSSDDVADLRTDSAIKNQLLWQIWMLERINQKMKNKSRNVTLLTFISNFEDDFNCTIFKMHDNLKKISKNQNEQITIVFQDLCIGLIKIGIDDVKSLRKFQLKLNGFVSINNLKDDCELEDAILSQINRD
ncbi:Hypothetical_protein [Hexamita inflata]|uniref:Hypothetical_protein n=1 Tax=Hexamita inflata TaxID=28002 RepID=A0AA86TVM5_9EUKA|nr:Hypothetical protein HINF_LOCUS16487 [Hexamita inflata]CAI9950324.1 Hypothetical protein HINF_LOCUS37969 [Hexamita inflata]